MRAIPCNSAQFRAISHFQFSIFLEIPKKRWIWFGFLTGIELDPIANLRIPLVYVVSRSTVLEQCHAITHFSPNWLSRHRCICTCTNPCSYFYACCIPAGISGQIQPINWRVNMSTILHRAYLEARLLWSCKIRSRLNEIIKFRHLACAKIWASITANFFYEASFVLPCNTRSYKTASYYFRKVNSC